MWVRGLPQGEGDAEEGGPGSSRIGPGGRSKGVVFVIQIVRTACCGRRESGTGASVETGVAERRGEWRGLVS